MQCDDTCRVPRGAEGSCWSPKGFLTSLWSSSTLTTFGPNQAIMVRRLNLKLSVDLVTTSTKIDRLGHQPTDVLAVRLLPQSRFCVYRSAPRARRSCGTWRRSVQSALVTS